MKKSDLYWLAGFMEGEGCFGFYSYATHKRYGYECVAFCTTDKDVGLRAANLLKLRLRDVAIRDKMTKPAYQAQVVGERAREIMRQLYSLMGNRRKNQINDAIKRGRAQWRDKKLA